MDDNVETAARNYWRANLKTVAICMVIWFLVSYGAGIIFAEALNNFRIAGFPVGFWFAQQGSIVIFLILIVYYTWRMNKLDRDYDVHEQ